MMNTRAPDGANNTTVECRQPETETGALFDSYVEIVESIEPNNFALLRNDDKYTASPSLFNPRQRICLTVGTVGTHRLFASSQQINSSHFQQ